MYSTTELASAMRTLATHPTRQGDDYHAAWDKIEWADSHLTEYDKANVRRVMEAMLDA